MNKLKSVIVAAFLAVMMFLLSGCITTVILGDKIKKKQELYCVVSLAQRSYEPLNGRLYDLSHEYNVGVYIIDDFAPDFANGAGEIVFSQEDYAKQVLAAHDELEPYDDFVCLAIGNNVLQFGEGGAAFADIAASGIMANVLTEDIGKDIAAKIANALEEAKITGEDEWDKSNISNDEYYDILNEYLDDLTPYLKKTAE